MLKPPPLKGFFPLPIASKMICISEKLPPIKSKITFSRDHPTVLFLFQFRYTYEGEGKELLEACT